MDISLDPIEKKSFTASLINNDIFHIKYKKGSVACVEDINDASACYAIFSKGKPLKALIETSKNSKLTAEGRRHAQNNPLEVTAEAYVIEHAYQRITLRFYVRLKKMNHPIKIFSNYDDAYAWLMSI